LICNLFLKPLQPALDAYHGKKNSQIFNSRAVLESNKPKQTKQTTFLPNKLKQTQTNEFTTTGFAPTLLRLCF